MTKWEQFEAWLFEHLPLGGRIGSNRDLAEAADITPAEASAWIASYLDAQRSKKATTLYVLRRGGGRTTNAEWWSGVRSADAGAVGHMYFDDTRAKFRRAVEPDLRRIAARNPRAAKRCATLIDAISDGAMRVLQAAVGLTDEED